MCNCPKHDDPSERCDCICPEHENFDKLYELAMTRYDTIVRLQGELTQAQGTIEHLRNPPEVSFNRAAQAFYEATCMSGDISYHHMTAKPTIVEGLQAAHKEIIA